MTCGACNGRGKVAVLRGMEDCCACLGSGVLCACGLPACEQNPLCAECTEDAGRTQHADNLNDAVKAERT